MDTPPCQVSIHMGAPWPQSRSAISADQIIIDDGMHRRNLPRASKGRWKRDVMGSPCAKACGEQLAGLRIVMAIFEQCLAGALGNAAMRLAMHDHRVDRAEHRRPRRSRRYRQPGFRIDLDLADLRAIRKACDRQGLVGNGGEWPLQLRRQVGAAGRRSGNLEDTELAIGAGDAESPGAKFDVADARLKQNGRRCDDPCR